MMFRKKVAKKFFNSDLPRYLGFKFFFKKNNIKKLIDFYFQIIKLIKRVILQMKLYIEK